MEITLEGAVRRTTVALAGTGVGERLVYHYGRRLKGNGHKPASVGVGEVLVPLADPGYRRLYLTGRYEDDVQALASHVLTEGDVAVDVGANFGVHTTLFAGLVGPLGHVWAFEPNPEIAMWLSRTVELNRWRERVTARQVAVGDHTGRIALFTHGSFGLTAATTEHSWLEGGERHDVELVTLDNALPRNRHVRLLKLDIEGGELAALHGAATVLAERPPDYLLVEFATFTDPALLALIESSGYRPVHLEGGRLVEYEPPIPEPSDAQPGNGDGFRFENVMFRHERACDAATA